MSDLAQFIRAATVVGTPPLLPELRLHLSADETDVSPLWEATEKHLGRTGLPPPFWAFCWAGGQALARHLLDHPELVRGRSVLDFGAGGGVVAIAAARAGAARSLANDIDPLACAAVRLNAALNGVAVEVVGRDVLGRDEGWDVVVAGDVCYERPTCDRIAAWLRTLAGRGAVVLIGDPGRFGLPRTGLEPLAHHRVPVTRALEDADTKQTGVWRVLAGEGGRS